ncbi:putative glycoside hydrolase, family 28, pectin lyase/virulence factor [Rosa chinensis]|uniref:Putative glycoside hydrolase, family 28, pectin lyase/virulence factor n=1 Tax=Rosa chinensis TaxID=74649 RepID=A0A2P6SN96_ROSCH|nr:putative glycoside hydrolase, family 28, pectin lyase/virulence factor [Rosa chinensis]
MSGGIRDVRVEDVTSINTESSIRIKTAKGRGADVNDIFVQRLTLNTVSIYRNLYVGIPFIQN